MTPSWLLSRYRRYDVSFWSPNGLCRIGTNLQLSFETAVEDLFHRSVYIAGCSATTFRNLVSLTLHHVRRLPDSRVDLFPGTSFPSLRAVYTTSTPFGKKRSSSIINGFHIEPSNLPKGQLDMLQVKLQQVNQFPSDLRHRGTLVLLSFDLYDASCLPCPSFLPLEHYLFTAGGLDDSATTNLSYPRLCHGQPFDEVPLPLRCLPPDAYSHRRPRHHPGRSPRGLCDA